MTIIKLRYEMKWSWFFSKSYFLAIEEPLDFRLEESEECDDDNVVDVLGDDDNVVDFLGDDDNVVDVLGDVPVGLYL